MDTIFWAAAVLAATATVALTLHSRKPLPQPALRPRGPGVPLIGHRADCGCRLDPHLHISEALAELDRRGQP